MESKTAPSQNPPPLSKERPGLRVAARRPRHPYQHWLGTLERRELLTIDLTGSFVTIASSMPSGSSQAVVLDIHNVGDTTFKGKVPVDVYALPQGQTFDVFNSPFGAPHVGTFSLAENLTAGADAHANVTLTLLPFMTAGNYQFYALIDRTHTIADGGSANNLFSSDAIAVTQPDIDLVPSVSGTTVVPNSIVAGTSVPAKIQVTVTNAGTVALPKLDGSSFNFLVIEGIFARPVGTLDASHDVALEPGNIIGSTAKVSQLASHKSASTTIAIDYGKLSQGDYDILFRVDTFHSLSETSEANNDLVFSTTPLHVAAPFIDLDITSATDTFGANVPAAALGKGTVTVKNLGNVTATGSVDVAFYATTTGDIADGILVGEQSFKVKLNASASSSALTVPLSMPTNPSSQTYTLVAKIMPTGFADNNSANDMEAIAGTVTAAPGTVDLHVFSVSNPFKTTAKPGDKGKVSVVVENLGDTAANGAVTVTIYASTTNSTDGAVVLGSTTAKESIGSQKRAKPITVNLEWGDPPADGTFNLLAVVSSAAPLTDNLPDNNVTAAGTVTVAHVATFFPFGYGDVLTLQKATLLGLSWIGKFKTNTGLTGTYNLSPGFEDIIPPTLYLTFTGKSPASFSLVLSASIPIGGNKLTFNFDPAGALASTTAPTTLTTAYIH